MIGLSRIFVRSPVPRPLWINSRQTRDERLRQAHGVLQYIIKLYLSIDHGGQWLKCSVSRVHWDGEMTDTHAVVQNRNVTKFQREFEPLQVKSLRNELSVPMSWDKELSITLSHGTSNALAQGALHNTKPWHKECNASLNIRYNCESIVSFQYSNRDDPF